MPHVSAPPLVAPLAPGIPRPLLSVMIPTFNRAEHLGQALASVLRQDLGSDQMQIEVVDNASTIGDSEAQTRTTGHNRVAYHRQPRNLGMVGNWNSCLERARGQWVHILHDDDYLLDGFYAEVLRLIREKSPEAISIRCFGVNGEGVRQWEGHDLSGSGPDRPRDSFLTGMPVQCGGMVVRRDIYERLGGFRPELSFCVDVDAWTRILFNSNAAFSPLCLFCFRMHGLSGSAAARRDATDLRELFEVLPLLQANMRLSPGEVGRYRRYCFDSVLARWIECRRTGDSQGARASWNLYKSETRTLGEMLRRVARRWKAAAKGL
jgi:glycosyltransferase involved in cell wall biosynthesis